MGSIKKSNQLLRVKHGKRQEIESVINEEAMLLASFIRGKRLWEPRVVPLPKIIMHKKSKQKKINNVSFQSFFPKCR